MSVKSAFVPSERGNLRTKVVLPDTVESDVHGRCQPEHDVGASRAFSAGRSFPTNARLYDLNRGPNLLFSGLSPPSPAAG
jgi:hypothetical protein